MSTIDWQPIETVPHDDCRLLYGYDISVANSWKTPADGIVLMYWMGPDDDDPDGEGEWVIHDLSGCSLDVVCDPPPILTHWADLPTNTPPGAA